MRGWLTALALWAVLAYLAGVAALEETRLNGRGTTTRARVGDSRWSDRRGFPTGWRHVDVAFHLPGGRTVRTAVDQYGWGDPPPYGSVVDVEYDRRDPIRARRAGDHGDLGMALAAGLGWLVLTGVGARRVVARLRA